MSQYKLAFVIIVALLAASAFPVGTPVQSVTEADPFKYPALADSKAFQRWLWAFEQRAYPLDYIPNGARQRALEDLQRMKAAQGISLASTEGPAPWSNIGPSPIQSGNEAFSGRVADIAVDPSDANHWLIGTAQGGLWETRDAGTTWSPRTDSQPSLAMGAIAFAPSDPRIVYAGTGEGVFSADSFAGAGVLKSTDSGDTWTTIAPEEFKRVSFSEIVVDPANANVVVAATTTGVAGRDGRVPPSPSPLGLIKSNNGGATWSVMLAGRTTDLQVNPADFNLQLAGIGDVFGNPANGLYRSTDAGNTWTSVRGPFNTAAGGMGRIEVEIAPSDTNVAYVSVQDSLNQAGNDGGLLGVWRTDNVWMDRPTWTELPANAGFNQERQWWYDHAISIDPADPSTIFLGGVTMRKFDGAGWTSVMRNLHADQHCLAWAGSRLIVGNDGGVWSTTDGGESWANHNTNLAITQFYDGSLHPTNASFVLGGSQDNGTELRTDTDSWRHVFGGDGGDSAVSFVNPDRDWVASFQRLGIVRTTSGGNSFFGAVDIGIDKTGAPFIARIEKCPVNDDVIVAGTDNLWRSSDFFSATPPTWSSNGPEMRNSQGASVGITALAFAPSDLACSVYAFGTSNGRLMLTTDQGASWTDIDSGNAVPDRFITDLAFDPADPSILYVALSGFNESTPGEPGHLFRATNLLSGAHNWSEIGPPIDTPHNTIAVDGADTGRLYVGTDVGVFESSDQGNTWLHNGPESGMPNVAVFDLQLNNVTGRLVAFTHGRGAFSNDTISRIDPPPILRSATLTLNGAAVNRADAGQAGLLITINGDNFRQDTEIAINGRTALIEPVPPEQAAMVRVIDLDKNLSIRNSAGALRIRSRNVMPISERSNVFTAGTLIGPQINRVKVRPKAAGFLLKIIGGDFRDGSTVIASTLSGTPVPVQSVAFLGSDFMKARVIEGAPGSGTQLRIQVVSLNGIRSNEVVVTAP